MEEDEGEGPKEGGAMMEGRKLLGREEEEAMQDGEHTASSNCTSV